MPDPAARLLADYRALTSSERSLWRSPLMWGAAVAILVIPVLYVALYLASVWDPYGRLPALPVALVNADVGTTERGKAYHLGRDLVAQLAQDPPVHLMPYPSEQAAQAAVRRGEVYFALTIPRDFSRRAVAGVSRDHGELRLYSAPGSSYFASRVGRSVAGELTTRLNETLGTHRWTVVQDSLEDVRRGFADIKRATGRLREGAGRLETGGGELASGAARLAGGARDAQAGGQRLTQGAQDLAAGVGRLTGGAARLSAGLRQLNAAAPGAAQLRPLEQGSRQVAAETAQLAGDLRQLGGGTQRLETGAAGLAGGSAHLDRGAQQLVRGLPDLQRGLGQLPGGDSQLGRGAAALAGGAGELEAGAWALASRLPALRTGLGQLAAGADRLSGGARALDSGAAQLGSGAQQLAAGLTQLQGPLPASLGEVRVSMSAALTGAQHLAVNGAQLQTGARQLQTGTEGLADRAHQAEAASSAAVNGAQHLAQGSGSLHAGAARLQAGAAQLAQKTGQARQGAGQAAAGAAQLARGTARLQTGARQLQAGAATLAAKADEAARGAGRLAQGAQTLDRGVRRAVAGNLKIKAALGQLTRQLPATADLERLSGGSQALAGSAAQLTGGLGSLAQGAGGLAGGARSLQAGAGKLRGGLAELDRRIPVDLQPLGGDPEGLSASVQVTEQQTAAVGTNGAAFAPYFMALALWVGCTLTTFIFPYLLLPESGRATSQAARVLRKLTVPAAYVVAQALLVVLGVHLLGVDFLHPGLVVLTSVLGSLTFMTLILALNLLLGGAGRLLALVLLIVQLAASGGSYPVELASPFFQAIHTIVPVTDVINALRSALFGSYEGQYGVFMSRMLLVGAVSCGAALLGRRFWQFTPDEKFRSPILSDVG